MGKNPLMVLLMLPLAVMIFLLFNVPAMAEATSEESPVDFVKIESENGTAHYVAIPKEGVEIDPDEEISPSAAPDLPTVVPETTNEAELGNQSQAESDHTGQAAPSIHLFIGLGGLVIVSAVALFGFKRLIQ